MARKKQKWQVGDYFGIPIEDDFLAVGQILGKYDWIGVACLITKMKISSKNLPLYEDIKIDKNDIIAAMFITEESLDKGFWHDPEYLDKLLISPDKKPENLIYKNK
jgi:hypothetical protein